MRHPSKLPTTLLLAGLVLGFAAGCGGASAAKQPATTAPPPTAASSSTTLPAATTTTIAPLPDTTGTDFVKVMENLDLMQNLASERADPRLLDFIYTPDSEERPVVEKFLRELVANGWHYDDSTRSSVSEVTAKTPLDGVAVVDLVSEQGTQIVKDGKGQVTKTGDGWKPRRERFGLFRGADGRWRIRDHNILGPV